MEEETHPKEWSSKAGFKPIIFNRKRPMISSLGIVCFLGAVLLVLSDLGNPEGYRWLFAWGLSVPTLAFGAYAKTPVVIWLGMILVYLPVILWFMP